ncbi:MAG: Dam family site-specific DNA-(adenine-N6)-methyltransferase [Nitratireductor sp.]
MHNAKRPNLGQDTNSPHLTHRRIIQDSMLDVQTSIPPFLKWAGGKRWLTASGVLDSIKTYNRYFEPFLGSGAVFFYLQPKVGVLSDFNQELINLYLEIRAHPEQFRRRLCEHKVNHCPEYYYRIRSSVPSDALGRASRFLYLNRTCWNGLYRVNLRGEFNVPIGTKTQVIYDSDDFVEISRILSNMHIRCVDFEETIDSADKDDLLYVDPPYTVNHNMNGFLKYNEKIFSWDDQLRLSKAIKRASLRGVKILISNADHHSVRNLYEDFAHVESIPRHSVIAGSVAGRKATSELLIKINVE